MKNREFMMTLDDEHLESVIYNLYEQNFDLADVVNEPTLSVTKWLSTEYDPKDRIWERVDRENDPEYYRAMGYEDEEDE